MADTPYSGPEVDAAVRILREDAQGAHNRALMARLDAMEERLGRMPVKELSPEEKAAEYDRLMAAQVPGSGGRPPAGSPALPQGRGGSGATAGKPADDGGKPPAPAAKPPTPPAEPAGRRAWWDGYQSQGG